MKIGEIVKDSLKFPFSAWKKYLMFGFLILISISSINLLLGFVGLLSISNSYAQGALILGILTVIALITTLLARGYNYRILKTSLNRQEQLPKFNIWPDMLKDGTKLTIVNIVYLIPLILFFIAFKASILTFFTVLLSVLSLLVLAQI